jgi:hypothetical protein
MGIAALVLGILGLLISLIPGLFLVALPFGVLALVLGIVGRKSATSNGQPTGTATAGMVLGLIACAFAVAMWVMCSMLVKGTKDAFEKGIGEPLKKAIAQAEKQARDERLNGVPLDPTHAIKVSARKLQDEFDANALAAQRAYQGKTCEVTGTLARVDKAFPIEGVPEAVVLEIEDVSCQMPVTQTEKALALKAGKAVTVLGRCELSLGPSLKGCILK